MSVVIIQEYIPILCFLSSLSLSFPFFVLHIYYSFSFLLNLLAFYLFKFSNKRDLVACLLLLPANSTDFSMSYLYPFQGTDLWRNIMRRVSESCVEVWPSTLKVLTGKPKMLPYSNTPLPSIFTAVYALWHLRKKILKLRNFMRCC